MSEATQNTDQHAEHDESQDQTDSQSTQYKRMRGEDTKNESDPWRGRLC